MGRTATSRIPKFQRANGRPPHRPRPTGAICRLSLGSETLAGRGWGINPTMRHGTFATGQARPDFWRAFRRHHLSPTASFSRGENCRTARSGRYSPSPKRQKSRRGRRRVRASHKYNCLTEGARLQREARSSLKGPITRGDETTVGVEGHSRQPQVRDISMLAARGGTVRSTRVSDARKHVQPGGLSAR